MSGAPPAKKRKIDDTVPEDGVDDAIPDDDSENDSETEAPSEKKGKNLKSFLHGITYQQKMLLLTLLTGVSNKDEFSLSTEEEMADKFDDVVYRRYTDKGLVITFLQAKHSQDATKKIGFQDLISMSTKEKFCLGKYFLSSLSINKNYKDSAVDKLILCSNIDLSKESLREQHIQIKDVPETFYLEGGFSLYQLVQIKDDEDEEDECPVTLVEHIRSASELRQLADVLVQFCLKPRRLMLKRYLFKRYHIVLFTKNILMDVVNEPIVNEPKAKFHPDFINGSNQDKKFYEIFKALYEKDALKKKLLQLFANAFCHI